MIAGKKYTVNIPLKSALITSQNDFIPNGEACLISITEPGNPAPKLLGPWKNIFRIAFWDVAERLDVGFILAGHTEGPIEPIKWEQSKAIADFIRAHWDDNIIVHCLAGKSRSAAVVRVLMELGWSELKTGFQAYNQDAANPTVYRLLKDHFGELHPNWYK